MGIKAAIGEMTQAVRHPVKTIGSSVSKLRQTADTTIKEVQVAVQPAKSFKEGYKRLKFYCIQKAYTNFGGIVRDELDYFEKNYESLDINVDVTITKDYINSQRTTKNNAKQTFLELLDYPFNSKVDPPQEHPAFQEIVKQLLPDEAILISYLSKTDQPQVLLHVKSAGRFNRGVKMILENFTSLGKDAGVRHPELMPVYIDNLCRLLLIRIYDAGIGLQGAYDLLEKSNAVENARTKILIEMRSKVRFDRRVINLTPWGRWFCKACL